MDKMLQAVMGYTIAQRTAGEAAARPMLFMGLDNIAAPILVAKQVSDQIVQKDQEIAAKAVTISQQQSALNEKDVELSEKEDANGSAIASLESQIITLARERDALQAELECQRDEEGGVSGGTDGIAETGDVDPSGGAAPESETGEASTPADIENPLAANLARALNSLQAKQTEIKAKQTEIENLQEQISQLQTASQNNDLSAQAQIESDIFQIAFKKPTVDDREYLQRLTRARDWLEKADDNMDPMALVLAMQGESRIIDDILDIFDESNPISHKIRVNYKIVIDAMRPLLDIVDERMAAHKAGTVMSEKTETISVTFPAIPAKAVNAGRIAKKPVAKVRKKKAATKRKKTNKSKGRK